MQAQGKTKFEITPEQIFIKYSDMVFALAYSRCSANYADAQDVTCEVFYRLVRKNPVFESDEHLRAWLVRVTVNCSVSVSTSAWRRHTAPMPESLATAPFDVKDNTVYNAVLQLEPKQRSAIHLFYYENFSVNEIAKAMGARPNTVKSWLMRGREHLRTTLSAEFEK